MLLGLSLRCRAGLGRLHFRRGMHISPPPPKTLCYVSVCTDPYANLAFEDWILRNSDPESYVLYLWRNRPSIVIGRNQNPWKECNLALMAERDVVLARRSSGGGAVYHDLGNTNYTVVMPREVFARDMCAEMVAKALQASDIPAYVNARHDVAVDGLKISGSAFKLTKLRAFHHGTMLIEADLTRLHGCLKSQAHGCIEAKGVASVPSPVVNLRDYSLSLDHSSFCDSVLRQFADAFAPPGNVAVVDTLSDPRTADERRRIQTWDWLYGQTPEFTHRFHRPFAWATVFASVTARHGRITDVSVGTAESALQPPPGSRLLFADIAARLKDVRYHPSDISESMMPLIDSDNPRASELCDWLISNLSFPAV
ncbi:hypothetical protein IWW37_003944 [Coemansia sp. RSA 2050]|nr:hypothetical protein IWW37_003944 [Coemansia sp. RSA 2050]KAJ2736673.1 hypothetical protein IW152_000642 [Coemansia sp. BCRC 34962]